MEKEYTNRGFRVFGHIPYRHGGAVRVQESSLAFEGPHVWLFIEGDKCKEHMGEHMMPTPQMNLEQVKQLISALQDFVNEAESENLTESCENQNGI
jgi:hypothetical protein